LLEVARVLGADLAVVTVQRLGVANFVGQADPTERLRSIARAARSERGGTERDQQGAPEERPDP
jgi:hypothetical protein